MKHPRQALFPILLAIGLGLNHANAAEKPGVSSSPAIHIAHRPPTPKDVIEAVIASGDLGLSVSPSCQNVGTEPSDTTIGRYLAGFLAEMSSPEKSNWVETKISAGTSSDGKSVWVCQLMLRHINGDDRWGWGVQFHVRQSDGLVLRNSMTCIGAG